MRRVFLQFRTLEYRPIASPALTSCSVPQRTANGFSRSVICSILSLSRSQSAIRIFHIANDGLSAVIYVNMLHADKLLPAMTQSSKDFHLQCKNLH